MHGELTGSQLSYSGKQGAPILIPNEISISCFLEFSQPSLCLFSQKTHTKEISSGIQIISLVLLQRTSGNSSRELGQANRRKDDKKKKKDHLPPGPIDAYLRRLRKNRVREQFPALGSPDSLIVFICLFLPHLPYSRHGVLTEKRRSTTDVFLEGAAIFGIRADADGAMQSPHPNAIPSRRGRDCSLGALPSLRLNAREGGITSMDIPLSICFPLFVCAF